VPRLEVLVRVDPAHLDELADYVGNSSMATAEQLDEVDPEGWTRLRLRINYPLDAPGRLLGMGSHLEVIGPPAVRERVVSLARGALVRHGA
jgi:hypothetical protein